MMVGSFELEVEDAPGAGFVWDAALDADVPFAEEVGVMASPEDELFAASSWTGATNSSRLSEVHPENKHTTPTHPKNVVIFFMTANIVYIFALN